MKPDSMMEIVKLLQIANDQMALVSKLVVALDEADRLLCLEYGGTERWVKELKAWRRSVQKLKNCQAD